MIVKFKIKAVYPEVRGIDVHYYTDAFPEGSTFHVAFYGDVVPTGAALVQHIMAYAPVAWLKLRGSPPADMEHVRALVGQEQAFDVPEKPGELSVGVL
jgi:hypothetical protein